MKYVLAIIIFTSAIVNEYGYKKKNLISWSHDYKLQWKDFKGKPHSNSKIGALTSSTILREKAKIFHDKVIFRLATYFIKNEAWKKKKINNSNHLLNHEQKHFDVAEIYARRMRKQMLEEKYSSLKEIIRRINKIYFEVDKALDIFQDLYDKETDHSSNIEAQERWNKKIEEELVSLEAYSNPEITLNIESEKKY